MTLSGLDWKVHPGPIVTWYGIPNPGFKAYLRGTDKNTLGVVTNRYMVQLGKAIDCLNCTRLSYLLRMVSFMSSCFPGCHRQNRT